MNFPITENDEVMVNVENELDPSEAATIPPIRELLPKAENGNHSECRDCHWTPSGKRIAFGTSCRTHGVDWHNHCRPISMQIVQDPGDTTPAETGNLCFTCNSENPTDRTAQQCFDLWRAAVSLRWDVETSDEYLKNHYWTNAILHGAPNTGNLRQYIDDARQSCSSLLREQITLLSPRVIIACGESAANSLYEIGLLEQKWKQFNSQFNSGAHKETCSSIFFKNLPPTIFCTYHTSARVVNQTVARRYGERTEYALERKIARLSRKDATRAFLDKYSDLSSRAHQGMRVLLLHWIDIGFAVREQFSR